MADEMLTGMLSKPKGPQAPGTTTNPYGGTVPSPVAQPPQTPGFQNNTANPQWWKGGAAPATTGAPAPMDATSGYGSSTPTPAPPPAGTPAPPPAGTPAEGTPPPTSTGPKPLPQSAVRMFRGFQAEIVKWQQELSYARARGDQHKINNAMYRINQAIQKLASFKLNWQNGGYDVSGV